MMYWPSSVGANGNTEKVSAGKNQSGVSVPSIWSARRKKVSPKVSPGEQAETNQALPHGEDRHGYRWPDQPEAHYLDGPGREFLGRAHAREELQRPEPAREDEAESDPEHRHTPPRERRG